MKHKKNERSMAFLQIRMPKDLRDDFIKKTKEEDESASHLIRKWIKDYLKNERQD